MANLRRYTNQFMNSFERQPLMLMGSAEQTGSVGAFSVLVDNGITYTANRMGVAGDDISVALVAGGTAGAEVVTVIGNAISVQIESGVSTQAQVQSAINGSPAAAALISVAVAAGATPAVLLAATHLASGADTPISMDAQAMVVAQIDTGTYEISINTPMADLLSASIMLQRLAPVDLISQIESVDASSRKIVFRMQAGATPTNLAADDILYIQLVVRPSSN